MWSHFTRTALYENFFCHTPGLERVTPKLSLRVGRCLLPQTLSLATYNSTLGGISNGLGCFLFWSSMCQHIPHEGRLKISVKFSYPHMRNEECSCWEWPSLTDEQFFHPLECAQADGVTVGHSVPLIHIAHMMVIIHHNLWLYSFSSLIAEITFCWGIVNIRQHAYVSCPATVLPASQPWLFLECLLLC